ncbi:Uncharacterised protein [Serratia grimesii]|jgi:hypothetical protein|uniref:DUF1090 domain-containing protein n=1 Tax=Serratia grimesii TaxID=82995 RepID=UPI00076F3AC6|nr:DUF1090 domain-containing protein [Serratia grimesii]CAI0997156.1 Protein of uncharacterised function (DUF1090) [Serratia grimesii]CUW24299.1 Uncharacterised protein [Serratia grimesii]SMZ58611.1 Uncharacterised protein [Serratia grimesii]
MKLRQSMLLALPLLFACPALSFAADNGCTIKAQNIQQQIDYATQHGNTQRVAGLKKALNEVQTHCTPASLQADRQKKIDEKQRKVTERQQELKEAQQTGNLEKVAKKQKKLAEAQAELKQAQAE